MHPVGQSGSFSLQALPTLIMLRINTNFALIELLNRFVNSIVFFKELNMMSGRKRPSFQNRPNKENDELLFFFLFFFFFFFFFFPYFEKISTSTYCGPQAKPSEEGNMRPDLGLFGRCRERERRKKKRREEKEKSTWSIIVFLSSCCKMSRGRLHFHVHFYYIE